MRERIGLPIYGHDFFTCPDLLSDHAASHEAVPEHLREAPQTSKVSVLAGISVNPLMLSHQNNLDLLTEYVLIKSDTMILAISMVIH
ncbi:MAG: hypothetical protein RBS82_01380 [Syntrophales bacterium]|jgi:hypothetical protein|nr:hypothetical protein [Syntrophales bacterium]